MCRNIRPLFNYDPPVTHSEIREAALQYVRKISGFNRPSMVNEAAFNIAVSSITAATAKLVSSLETKPRRAAALTKLRGLMPWLSAGFQKGNKMRKLIVSEFLTLDGVMEDPKWSAPYWNDEIAKFKFDELFACDTLLLGRITYQGFAEAWPNSKDEQGYADRMNSMAKLVVSRTLDKVGWNHSRLIIATVNEEIARLKELAGQDILIFGSAQLVNSLDTRRFN